MCQTFCGLWSGRRRRDYNTTEISERPLRDEWKFGGLLLSDYDSIGELVKHGISANLAEAANESFSIGLDMDMESGAYQKNLAQLILDKKISEKSLDESVRRVLRLKNKLGLFENPYANAEREKLVLLSKEKPKSRARHRQKINRSVEKRK